MKYVVLLGRVFYSLIFIMGGLEHFSQPTIHYATSQGVLMAQLLVPLAGLLALLGGLSILIGYKARYGAWLIIIFLIPTTLIMHQFWNFKDIIMATSCHKSCFFKNLSMLGAALLITHFGSGPISLDQKLKRSK